MNWKYENGKIYSLDENATLMAEATYEMKENGEMDINHVYVNELFRGQGLADKTMQAMVEYLREKKIKATASCSYANTWFGKHSEECKDVISVDIEYGAAACRVDGKH